VQRSLLRLNRAFSEVSKGSGFLLLGLAGGFLFCSSRFFFLNTASGEGISI